LFERSLDFVLNNILCNYIQFLLDCISLFGFVITTPSFDITSFLVTTVTASSRVTMVLTIVLPAIASMIVISLILFLIFIIVLLRLNQLTLTDRVAVPMNGARRIGIVMTSRRGLLVLFLLFDLLLFDFLLSDRLALRSSMLRNFS